MANYTLFQFKEAWSMIKNGKSCDHNFDANFKFSSIYCLKALGAFFVICIHCYKPWIIYPIIRTAVPFFFMISGFFLYREDSEQALQKCIHAFKKVAWITLYANLFYYLCFFVPSDLWPFKDLESVIDFLYVGNTLGHHLWYLNAYLEAMIVIMIALKFKVLKYLWYLIPLFVLWGLMTGNYHFLFPYLSDDIILSRNFYTMGIPCIGIGWMMRKYSPQLLKRISYPIVLCAAILVISELEIILLKYAGHTVIGDYFITTYLVAASMMLIGVKYPLLGKNSIIEKIGKTYSTDIYIFHVFILLLFIPLNEKYMGLHPSTYPFIGFIFTYLFIRIWKKCSQKMF